MVTERPHTKSGLPFRAFRDPTGAIQLECFNTLPDGQRTPFVVHVGDPNEPVDRQCYPIGQNVYQLMQQFWELEGRMEGLAKERDEALSRAGILETELATATKRAEGMKHAAQGKGK